MSRADDIRDAVERFEAGPCATGRPRVLTQILQLLGQLGMTAVLLPGDLTAAQVRAIRVAVEPTGKAACGPLAMGGAVFTRTVAGVRITLTMAPEMKGREKVGSHGRARKA